jgi:alkanesulfonate monooxygenase SsuD/methylene tetrahydromethanopterin reductase-like flavin-dependent oxidoreductase (luciferase family)
MPTNAHDGPSPSTRPRWGVLLPTFDSLHTGRSAELVAGARRAEELGFDAGWVGDHLACQAPVLDSMMALSAAAAVTEHLTLGFSVLLLGLRMPELAAQQIATIDALADGRLVLGVGVGGEYPAEFVASGVSVHRRGALLDDALTVLTGLLLGHKVDHAGRARDVHVPAREPLMSHVPRILVGGRSEAALRRTARFANGWLPMWLSPDQIRERGERLQELATAAGRPTPSITVLILVCVDDDLEVARQAAAEHLDGQYRLPLRVVEHWAALGPEERVAAELQTYLDTGVSELILMPLGREPLRQYERIAAVRELVDGRAGLQAASASERPPAAIARGVVATHL